MPQELHPPIDQGAVVLGAAADPAAAQAFLDFVLGPDGRIVLDRYGFLLPEGVDGLAGGRAHPAPGVADDPHPGLRRDAIAWWLATTHRPWRGLVHALVALPLVLPPTVLGFYLLLAMGPDGPIGGLTEALGIGRLPFTFAGILLASVIYSLPFMVQPLVVAFSGVDRSLLEASWTLGRSRLATFFRIVVPLRRRGS